MLIKPEIAKVFDEYAGPFGGDMIRQVIRFFDAIEFNEAYDWVNYMKVKYYQYSLRDGDIDWMYDFHVSSKQCVENKPDATPTKTTDQKIKRLEENLKIKEDLAAAKKLQAETPVFRTEANLIAALDREFPGRNWPADKSIIANEPNMKAKLEQFERERIALANETPEERTARQVKEKIHQELLFYFMRHGAQQSVTKPEIKVKQPVAPKKPAIKGTNKRV